MTEIDERKAKWKLSTIADPWPQNEIDRLNRQNAALVDTVDILVKIIGEHHLAKHGRWKKIGPAGPYECSECGQNVMTADIECYKYCNSCGAKMDA